MVKQGDIIKIDFSPTSGNEQSGYRPAVVVSNEVVIERSGVVLVCPVTNTTKRTFLNVLLDDQTQTQGAVLCGQTRAIDLKSRPYRIIESLSDEKLKEVLRTIAKMLEQSEGVGI